MIDLHTVRVITSYGAAEHSLLFYRHRIFVYIEFDIFKLREMNQVWLFVLLGYLLFAVDVNSERSPDTILSRQKRYLIFPEGSSLQLGKLNQFVPSVSFVIAYFFDIYSFSIVYDQIVPIVNNENFIIFGLTVAMAWELPSKPSYPAETDKISRKKYDKKKTTIKDDEQFVNQQKIPNNVNLYDHEHYHNYMNNDFRNYLLHKINQKLATNAYQFIKPIKYEFNNALSTHKQNTSNIFFDDSVVRYQPYSRYPALRTRRDITHKHVSNSSENLHSLKHHILSRENLYEKIVKYLTA